MYTFYEHRLLCSPPPPATPLRCSRMVPRHIVYLTNEGAGGPPAKTLMLLAKGVTYDAVGADKKAGRVMTGMQR